MNIKFYGLKNIRKLRNIDAVKTGYENLILNYDIKQNIQRLTGYNAKSLWIIINFFTNLSEALKKI